MTMDWTVDQIFSELQNSGGRNQQQHQHQQQQPFPDFQHQRLLESSSMKFDDSSSYMDDLDQLLNEDGWREDLEVESIQQSTFNNDVYGHDTNSIQQATLSTTSRAQSPHSNEVYKTESPSQSYHNSKEVYSVEDEEEMDPTPSILAYLPSPPSQLPSPEEDDEVIIEEPEMDPTESETTMASPILLPPPMEYRDKVEEEEGPPSVFTSSSVRSLSPTSPFTW